MSTHATKIGDIHIYLHPYTWSIYFKSTNCAHTNRGRGLFLSLMLMFRTDFGACAIDFHCILPRATPTGGEDAQPSQCFVVADV